MEHEEPMEIVDLGSEAAFDKELSSKAQLQYPKHLLASQAKTRYRDL